MKIGVILRYLWIAGAPKIAAYQVRGLNEMGYKARLFILAVSPKYRGEYDDIINSIPHKFINVHNIFKKIEIVLSKILFSKTRPGERVLPIFTIIPALKTIRDYDILLCHDPFSGIIGFLGKILYNKKYIVYIHEKTSDSLFFKLFEEIILKFADYVLAVSDKVAGYAEKHTKIRVKPLPPGFPVDLKINERVKAYVDKKALIAARWDINRRPDWMIKIAEETKELKFIITGYWQDKEVLKSFLEKAVKFNNIKIYTSPVAERDFIKMIDRAFVIIRMNVGELGIATLSWEAVHKGVPVIVNSELGSAEYVKNFNCGVVVSSVDNVNEVEKALNIINDNYKNFVKNCLKLSKEYSIYNHAKQIIRIIEDIHIS